MPLFAKLLVRHYTSIENASKPKNQKKHKANDMRKGHTFDSQSIYARMPHQLEHNSL